MIQELQLRVLPEVAADSDQFRRYLANEKGLALSALKGVRVLKRSIDARQRTIYVNLKVRLYVNELPADDAFVRTNYNDVSEGQQVIVVGARPGGLFAALRLIELGLRPIVLERGKDVHERKKDLALISRTQQVDEQSNYCFGEGGAGAYSDGKLYTRSKKRGNTDKILNVFCQHGASTAILADAHPHIGTDRLPQVIEAMRNTIISHGGEVHFQTQMTQLLLEGNCVVGCVAGEREYLGPVILATGHSARDVYRYLAKQEIEIEPKGIAVGVHFFLFSFRHHVFELGDNQFCINGIYSLLNAWDNNTLLISLDIPSQRASIIRGRSIKLVKTIKRTTSIGVSNTDRLFHIDTLPVLHIAHNTSSEDIRVIYSIYNGRHNIIVSDSCNSFTKYCHSIQFLSYYFIKQKTHPWARVCLIFL